MELGVHGVHRVDGVEGIEGLGVVVRRLPAEHHQHAHGHAHAGREDAIKMLFVIRSPSRRPVVSLALSWGLESRRGGRWRTVPPESDKTWEARLETGYHPPMTPHPLELYRVSGTHREVGIQMGELGAEQIRRGSRPSTRISPKAGHETSS